MDDVKGVDYNGRYLFKLRNLLERLSRERESSFDVRKQGLKCNSFRIT